MIVYNDKKSILILAYLQLDSIYTLACPWALSHAAYTVIWKILQYFFVR